MATSEKARLLGNKNFMFLWTGQIASKFALRITQIALVWWVITTTGHTAVLGTLLLFLGIPEVLLGPLAGTYVDRWPKKWFIVGSDFFKGLLILIMAVLMIRDGLNLPLLALGLFLVGSLTAFFRPALLSSVPSLVQKELLTRANSMVQLTITLSGLLGPAIGVFLVEVLGIVATFFLTGSIYVLSAFLETFINIPPAAGEDREARGSFQQDLRQGFSFVRSNRLILGLFLSLGLVGFFTAPIIPLVLPVIIESILKMSSVELGFMASAVSLGVLIAAAYLGVRKRIKKRYFYLITGVAGFGLTLLFKAFLAGYLINYSLQLTYLLLLLSFFLLGLCLGMVKVNVLTLMQLKVPEELRGKAMGFAGTLGGGVVPISQASYGFILTFIALPNVLIFNGSLVILMSIYMLRLPGLREL